MTPYYADDWLTVYQGDNRAVLADLPDESVHCVVTSPPYWGLRDYGVGGQLGLEPTPEKYVANMVAVFREVRRVLRRDGTLWLNLGSSFASQGGERVYGSFDGATGRGPSPQHRFGAGASGRSRSRRPERAPAYGSDGTEPRGSTGPGSAYPDLCDGCRAVLSSRTTDTIRPLRDDASPRSPIARDSEPPGSAEASPLASQPDAPASTSPRSETLPPAECSHCGNCGVCLAVTRSPSRDARLCVHRSAYSDDTDSPSGPSAARTSGMVSSGLAWGDYTSTIKPKDLVPIPWMVAFALQADGWYLRSDIIWAKPNPMPESVTDRPTKSHEYVFLLSKSARYYYDAEAVREASTGRTDVGKMSFRADIGAGGVWRDEERTGDVSARNLRSVWTIATQPYPGAHFATFPRKLVEPCVKAGTSERGVCPECGAPWVRELERTLGVSVAAARPKRTAGMDSPTSTLSYSGGSARWQEVGPRSSTTGWRPSCRHVAEPIGAVVLDPFAGSGTTGMVAQSLSRRAVLIDLSGDYLIQAMERNRDIPLGLDVA